MTTLLHISSYVISFSILTYPFQTSIYKYMKPTDLRLRPQIQIPSISLEKFLEYPQLQKRINNSQFQVSGIHNLIVQLKKQALQELKEQFINNNNNVNLEQFVWLISNSLQSNIGVGKGSPDSFENRYYQYQIQYELVKAFEEIDVDESDSISWEEYIQYITSSSLIGISGGDPDEQPISSNIVFNAKEVVYSHREKTSFRKNPIRKIIELEKQRILAVIQSKSDNLTFIGADGSHLSKPPNLQGVDCSKVLSFDYCQEERIFGVLMNNHRVVFIEDGEMPKTHGQNKFSGDQIQIIYLKKHKLWALISLNHFLQIFEPPRGRKDAQNVQKVLFMFRPHQSSLLGLKQLHNPLAICTASIQGELKLWSLASNQLLIDIRPCKQEDFLKCKAIKGFQVYNKDTTSFFLCWMFSSEISVWLPSSSLSKPYLGKLKGHIGIVEQAKFFHNFPCAISIDSKHSVRVWDVSKLQCLQTWRLQANTSINIHILHCSPYALFYEKTIDFYKISKEEGLINFLKAKGTQEATFNKQKQKDKKRKPSILALEQTHRRKKSVKFKRTVSYKKVINDDDPLLSIANIQLGQSILDMSQSSDGFIQKRPLQILYDEYFDCLIIMLPQVVKLIAINSGKTLNSIPVTKKSQRFISISLNGRRKIFIANNLGQIGFYRLQDCSLLSKIQLLEDYESQDPKNVQDHKKKNLYESKLNIQSNHSKYEKSNKFSIQIIGINYNIYNNVLLIVTEIQKKSMVITYDNFSSLSPSKKKQIIFDQNNIHSFASSQKFNLFFIGSSQPELVTIWDYHNFNIIKTIQFAFKIKQIKVDGQKYNLLFVVSNFQIRALRLATIEAKNNSRTNEDVDIKSIVKAHGVVRSNEIITSCAFIMLNKNMPVNQKNNKKSKNKVHFQDDSPAQVTQFNNFTPTKHGLYIARGQNIAFIKFSSFIEITDLSPQPVHCSKANITKQIKNINCVKDILPDNTNSISANEITGQVITSFKQNIDAIDVVKEFLFFSTQADLLNFYNTCECFLSAKLSIPKLEIVDWKICQKLAGKILQRMYKAQMISKQIYSYKKNKAQSISQVNYLRLAFFLNKYFCAQDIEKINQYFLNQQLRNDKNHKFIQPKNKFDNGISKHQKNILEGEAIPGQAKNFFHQHNDERNRLRSQSIQKMKEIEKKYSRAFSYIKGKGSVSKVEKGKSIVKDEQFIKADTPLMKKKNGSCSQFKIRNTAGSANKMYVQQSKEIKECLKKIGILNKASKLKL